MKIANIINGGVVALVLLSTGCSYTMEHQGKTDVAAVYWHEGTRFSVAIQEGQDIRLVSLPSDIPVTITQDVPPGQACWYEYQRLFSEGLGTKQEGSRLHIHIRNIDDIQTGAWNHGKFGSGQTVRLESE